MSASWISCLAFAATTLLVMAIGAAINDYFLRYRGIVQDRIDELRGVHKGNASESLFRDLKQLSALTAQEDSAWQFRLQEWYEQSGLKLTAAQLVYWSLALATVGAAAAVGLSKNWWLAPLGLVIGLIGPAGYVVVKRRLRLRRLGLQLPEVFEVMARMVRAGQTVPAALQIVADDFEAPISEEFHYCYEQQRLGMAYDAVLRKLARRTGIMELRILVVALLVQSRSGGNLVELLDSLADLARKRIHLQQRVKALTGEGRMQAGVLIVLPIAAFVALQLLSPEYAQALLDRPWLLGGTAAAQVVGALWIRQIVNFDF